MRTFMTAILIVLTASLAARPPHAGADDLPNHTTADMRATLVKVVPGLTVSEINALLSQGRVTRSYAPPDRPRLTPAFADVIADDVEALSPKLGVELLMLHEVPAAGIADDEVFTILHAVSTMEGIEYYSASRGYMRTLFYESYVVDGPANRERLPDPVWMTVPPRNTMYIYQRDSSFGKNILRLDYRTQDGAMLLTMRNLTRMMYQGIVPALGPGQLVLHFVVVPLGTYELFYGGAIASPLNLLGMQDRARDSFSNRILALYNWYTGQLAARGHTEK